MNLDATVELRTRSCSPERAPTGGNGGRQHHLQLTLSQASFWTPERAIALVCRSVASAWSSALAVTAATMACLSLFRLWPWQACDDGRRAVLCDLRQRSLLDDLSPDLLADAA